MPSPRTTAVAIAAVGTLVTGLAAASVVASSFEAADSSTASEVAATPAPSATATTGPASAAGTRGPRGFRGETGATGPQGATGARGPTGATGAQGPAGAAAPAPEFEQRPGGSAVRATSDVAIDSTSSLTTSTAWYRLTGSTTLQVDAGTATADCALVVDGAAGARSSAEVGTRPVNVTVDGVAKMGAGHTFGLSCTVRIGSATPTATWGPIAFVTERIHS